MLSTTDDLRISELKELSTPQEVMRRDTAHLDRDARGDGGAQRHPRHPERDRRPPAGRRRPLLGARSRRRRGVRRAPRRLARTAGRPPRDRDARLFREAAHHGRMEGADQRSRPRRQLRHQQGPAAGAQRAVGGEQSRPAGRDRIPRHDDAAIHRRPDGMGGDRRAHDREPDPSRAGVRAFLPGRLQERHRRQCPHRSRCREVGLASAPFHGGDQGRPLGDRGNHRQRGLPHHPARRPPAELRPGQRRCRVPSNLSVPAWRRGS